MSRQRRFVVLPLFIAACRPAASTGAYPIPLGDRAPWQAVLTDSGFRIAMDTLHVQRGSANDWFVWFVTAHAAPRGPDSLRFDRGRIRLLVRCAPLAFKSVSQELALGTAPPVFHKEWNLHGRDSVTWNTPDTAATDGHFLRAACDILSRRRRAT